MNFEATIFEQPIIAKLAFLIENLKTWGRIWLWMTFNVLSTLWGSIVKKSVFTKLEKLLACPWLESGTWRGKSGTCHDANYCSVFSRLSESVDSKLDESLGLNLVSCFTKKFKIPSNQVAPEPFWSIVRQSVDIKIGWIWLAWIIVDWDFFQNWPLREPRRGEGDETMGDEQ